LCRIHFFDKKQKNYHGIERFFGCFEIVSKKKEVVKLKKIIIFFCVELILTLSRILFSPFYDCVEILEKKYPSNNKFYNYKSIFCNSFEKLVDGVQSIAWSSNILPDANDIFDAFIV